MELCMLLHLYINSPKIACYAYIYFTIKIRALLQPHHMRKTLLLLFFLCNAGFLCYAQKPLTSSRQSSYYTYIYKLKPEDVLSFYMHPGKDPDEKILRNPIDSFKTDKYWENNLPPGNYLKVYAEENRLQYKLIENHTAFLKLMPNDYNLRFIFLDRKENVITNVIARVNNKPVPYDAKRGLYCVGYSKKDTLLQIDYAGVINFFSVKQQRYYYHPRFHYLLMRKWSSIKNIFKKHNTYNYNQRSGQNFTGFMVFNKAKYKPNDTVKFKAFILNRNSKKPIAASQLLVRLKEDYSDNGKIIGRVISYRDGGFEYQFVLSDSLKLSLDRDYYISLEDPASAKYDLDKYDGDDDEKFLARRMVYVSGRFSYEDYELKSISFSSRADKKEHSPGKPLAVYLKAVDENNLPVPDGRISLTLTTNNRYNNTKTSMFLYLIPYGHIKCRLTRLERRR